MSDRLFIAIPCYNRRDIAEQCIPTVFAGKHRDDWLAIYDDGSHEPMTYSPTLMGSCDEITATESMGVDAQRRQHFLDFMARPEFTHLYLTDSDAPHDPEWRGRAIALQADHKAPVCLYRTKTHADYTNNVFRDEPSESVLWQRFAPGVSYFLTREMVERVVKVMPDKWSWDWFVPGALGYRMAISRVSFCDHIDRGGLHSPDGELGPERAVAPSEWLAHKRQEILWKLGLKDA